MIRRKHTFKPVNSSIGEERKRKYLWFQFIQLWNGNIITVEAQSNALRSCVMCKCSGVTGEYWDKHSSSQKPFRMVKSKVPCAKFWNDSFKLADVATNTIFSYALKSKGAQCTSIFCENGTAVSGSSSEPLAQFPLISAGAYGWERGLAGNSAIT